LGASRIAVGDYWNIGVGVVGCLHFEVITVFCRFVLRFGGSDVKRFLAFESRVAPPRERGSKAFLFLMVIYA
jgi:hypothetical protein